MKKAFDKHIKNETIAFNVKISQKMIYGKRKLNFLKNKLNLL